MRFGKAILFIYLFFLVEELLESFSVFYAMKCFNVIPLKENLWLDFCQTSPFGCLSCSNVIFKMKSLGPHTRLGEAETCRYAIIPTKYQYDYIYEYML